MFTIFDLCTMVQQISIDPSPLSFGTFFERYLTQMHPYLAKRLAYGDANYAATIKMFRYDTHLTKAFTETTISAFVQRIATILRINDRNAEAVFSLYFQAAARLYFSSCWDNIPAFVDANASRLKLLRVQNVNTRQIRDGFKNVEGPRQVDLPILTVLSKFKLPVIVFVYSKYSSLCTTIWENFKQAEERLRGEALFLTLDGVSDTEFTTTNHVESFPDIIRFYNQSDVSRFPIHTTAATVENIVSFSSGKGFSTQIPMGKAVSPQERNVNQALDDPFSSMNNTSKWFIKLIDHGIDEIPKIMEHRIETVQSIIESSMGRKNMTENRSCIQPQRSLSDGHIPPVCILLGGGMAAGKTSAMNLVKNTEFWKKHGSGIVVVEADAFKIADPLFHCLKSVSAEAARLVHFDSVIAAEKLLVEAVNARRNIVFDGTLAWHEYALQTVNMMRDRHYTFARGPGYVKDHLGNITEQYWNRVEKRQTPVDAYQVELVGVTADPEEAIMRGIVRRIMTGRGVTVKDQLSSHIKFSENFVRYIPLMNSVYLFDTSLNIKSRRDEEIHFKDQLVAIKPGFLFQNPLLTAGESYVSYFHILLPETYNMFLSRRDMFNEASNNRELYRMNMRD